MLLNILPVLKNPDLILNFDDDISINNSDFVHEAVSFDKPVHISGTVKNVGGVVVMSAKVCAEYNTLCDRCMQPVSKEINFDFEESFVKEIDSDNDEFANLFDGEVIDVSDYTFKNIFLNLPLKNLCKEDCKGICQKCGTNLNVSSCDCVDDEWNPQFDILKHLFD